MADHLLTSSRNTSFAVVDIDPYKNNNGHEGQGHTPYVSEPEPRSKYVDA